MFYNYIFAHNSNCDLQNSYNFFAIYDKYDKLKIANRIIKNDSKRFKINDSYIEEDSLFLVYSFAYNISENFCVNYDIGEDQRAFTSYYNFITGKRKSKITNERLEEIKQNTFERAFETGYNYSFYGHTFFFKDRHDNIQYGHKCSLAFLYNKQKQNNIIDYFSMGSLNKQNMEDNYFMFPNTYIYDKFDSYGQKANRKSYIPQSGYILKSQLPDKSFKDIDMCDFIMISNHTIYYNVLINFKRYINNYDFTKDLSADLYCHNIDMNNLDIYNDYLNIYDNHKCRIKELFKNYINKMRFE